MQKNQDTEVAVFILMLSLDAFLQNSTTKLSGTSDLQFRWAGRNIYVKGKILLREGGERNV